MLFNLDALRDGMVRQRKAWGLSRQDVAALVGKTEWTIMKWETGLRTPSLIDMIKWANCLAVDVTLAERG